MSEYDPEGIVHLTLQNKYPYPLRENQMKTYREISNDLVLKDNPEQIDESVIRTATSIALVSKIRNLYNKIKSNRFSKNDAPEVQLEKLFSKIDMLSDQSIKLSYLIAQLAYMKERK